MLNYLRCNGKSTADKQIRRAAAIGADKLYALRETLGVAANCGQCAAMASDVLYNANDRQSQPMMCAPSSA